MSGPASGASSGRTLLSPGVWGVLATPFRDEGRRVDVDSLRGEVALYDRLGATGVVALGVFGEAASLSAAEQAEVVATVAEASPVPVVAGLSARASAPAVEQARLLCDATGGRLLAVMVQVGSPDPVAVGRTLDEIHEKTGLAVVVQDYPVVSGVTVRPEVLVEVVAGRDHVAGVKCEGPPTPVAISVLAGRVEVPVFGGLGGVGLVDELAAGAAGAMTGFSCPEGLLAAVAAFREGGFAAAHRAFSPWLPLANFEGQPGIGLAIRKEILRRRGVIADGAVRPPAPRLPACLVPLLERHLDNLPQPIDLVRP